MMLNLTNALNDLRGKPILIAVRHVVSIRPVNDETAILTVTGVEYRVQESMDEIGKMRAYARYSPSGSDYRSNFYASLRRWRFETMISSSADEIISNASFREIVAMGKMAVPLIIDELKKRPDFLVAALHLITGENPVPPNSAGDMPKMTEAWLDWYEHNR